METYRKSQNSMFLFGMHAAALVAISVLIMLLTPHSVCAVVIDGIDCSIAESPQGKEVSTYFDIVGSTSDSSRENPWTGKGNAFRVDTSRILLEQEFFLDFTTTQTLSFYVYKSPVEFGTYNQAHKNSYVVTGNGANWYSSGQIHVPLEEGQFYIIALSWNGSLEYFYGVGDSQPVSFGSQVHGFAGGFDPLGPTISSTGNDYAIYYQRLSTVPEPGTILLVGLGGLALFRKRRA